MNDDWDGFEIRHIGPIKQQFDHLMKILDPGDTLADELESIRKDNPLAPWIKAINCVARAISTDEGSLCCQLKRVKLLSTLLTPHTRHLDPKTATQLAKLLTEKLQKELGNSLIPLLGLGPSNSLIEAFAKWMDEVPAYRLATLQACKHLATAFKSKLKKSFIRLLKVTIDENIRQEAILALETLGTEGKLAQTDLARVAAERPDHEISHLAARALVAIGAEPLTLFKALGSPTIEGLIDALRSLEHSGAALRLGLEQILETRGSRPNQSNLEVQRYDIDGMDITLQRDGRQASLSVAHLEVGNKAPGKPRSVKLTSKDITILTPLLENSGVSRAELYRRAEERESTPASVNMAISRLKERLTVLALTIEYKRENGWYYLKRTHLA